MYIGIRIPGHKLHHVSLAYLGESEDDTLDQYKRAAAATSAALAFWNAPITLEFGGLGRFEPPFVWYAAVECENLEKFFPKLVETLHYYGVEFRQHEEYTPHVTLSRWPKAPRNPYEGQFLIVDHITLVSTKFGDTDFYI